ncbi:MAG: hypothetical protein Q9222_005345 [Ikaeria aurantiellina]
MPDSSTLSESPQSDHKIRSLHHWRAKLSRKDGKTSKDGDNREQEVRDFLHAPITADTARHSPDPELHHAAERSNHVSSSPDAPSPRITRRKPRRPGLQVAFTTEPPTLIGEGGDEALLPATEVSSSLRSSTRSAAGVFLDPVDYHEKEGQTNEAELFTLRTLQRRSTGLQSDEVIEPYSNDFKTLGNNRQSRSELIGHSFEQQQEMPPGHQQVSQLVSGQAQQHFTKAVTPPCGDAVNPRHSRSTSQQEINARPTDLLNPVTTCSNSLTPSPSPLPSKGSSTSSDNGYPFPAASFDDNPQVLPIESSHLEGDREPWPQHGLSDAVNKRPKTTLSDDAEKSADDAVRNFAARVQSFRSLFLLGIDVRSNATFYHWISAAVWWFLKGRGVLESLVKSRFKTVIADEITSQGASPMLKQAYVNLAKTWFVIFEMIPTRYPEVGRSENEVHMPKGAVTKELDSMQSAEMFRAYSSIKSNFQSLVTSMERNHKMPPIGLELQGSDVRIFLAYSSLSPHVAKLLTSRRSSMSDDRASLGSGFGTLMPISDTGSHFNYGGMFVNVILNSQNAESGNSIPCLLSILRDRRDRDVTMLLASQDGQVRLVIQPDGGQGISWRNVRWITKERCIQLDLNERLILWVEFDERDFKTIWGIHDYIRSVDKLSWGSGNETLLTEIGLQSFQSFNQDKSSTRFPTNRVERCQLRLLECFQISSEVSGQRKIHDGYRLMIVTPTQIKTLSYMNERLGRQQPLLYGFLRDEHGAAALLLKSSKSSGSPYMVMNFYKEVDRRILHSLLSGNAKSEEEDCSGSLSLAKYTMSTKSNGRERESWMDDGGLLESLMWNKVEIFRQRSTKTRLGGSLIRISPGGILIRLDVHSPNRLTIFRPPQSRMTLCLADKKLSEKTYESFHRLLEDIRHSSSHPAFDFHSLNDLHAFQAHATGFATLFDGYTKTFTISRGRSVVAIHKRWEAFITRLQVVKNERMIQLLAFFAGFGRGSCMSFVLRSTDVFESFNRSGSFYLCMVEAKFALPKTESDANYDCLCLDQPDYSTEHDDITIGFDTEEGRSKSLKF